MTCAECGLLSDLSWRGQRHFPVRVFDELTLLRQYPLTLKERERFMTLETLSWLGMAAYAAHILEEYTLDWRGWARAVLGLPAEWNDFYVTNFVVVALGIAQAMLARSLPLAVLSYAGLELINGTLMHIIPFIRTRGRFSPGLITGTFFFVPLGITTYWTALSSGLAGFGTALLGLLIRALTLAFPIVMLIVKSKPYFRQEKQQRD
jgi:Protein of unknown function with HXXEE motif